MERIAFGKDLELSRIVYGMWRLADDANTAPAHVQAKIEACLEQGITTFDQADIYGDYSAEGVLGTALRASPSLRDKMEIVTKCGIVAPCGRYSDAKVKYYDTTPAHISKSVDTSLSEMGIEHIDLLLIHRPDPFMDPAETGAALDAAVASGKVGQVGVSNFRPWDVDLLQAHMNAPLVTNQIEISLAEVSAFTNGDISYHQKRGDPLMAWSPLGGGSLFAGNSRIADVADDIAAQHGVDRAAIAVAFLLAHPARIVPVMGTNNLDRIGRISDALKVTLDRESWFRLYESALGHEVP